MKKIVALIVLATSTLAFAANMPLVDGHLHAAVANNELTYATNPNAFKSQAAGQLLIGTQTNLNRTVWISTQGNTTNKWVKIAP